MFGNRQSFTYVNIKDGKLVIKKDSQVETFEEVTGIVVNIEITDEEYKEDKYKRLSLTLVGSNNESCKLQLKLSSGYGRAVCNALPNADLTKPITFVPFLKEVDGKEKRGMFLTQNGSGIKWKFTKENPGGMPALLVTEFKGKKMYDDTAQQAFYTNLLLNEIKPTLTHAAIAIPTDLSREADKQDAAGDDLPF